MPAQTAGASAAVPPGPACPWWGLPQLRAMRRDYLGFTSRLRRDHGDIVSLRLGNERAVDVFAPELVRGLLVDHAPHLVRWERGIEVFEQLLGQSVLVTEGAQWQRQRRMLMPGFTAKRVAGYAALMVDAAVAGLDVALPPGQTQGRVAMDSLFSRLAMDVILRTLFSSRAATDSEAAIDAVQVTSQAAMREMFMPFSWPRWMPLPSVVAKRRALKVLKGLVSRHIEQRRSASPQPPRDDVLDMLLGLRDEATGQPLSHAEVFDQCMVTFQAGHETSATALLWWSHLMASHPHALQRAQAEVDTVLAGRAPGPDDMAALPWLTATLKEAMRLYPPAAALMSRRVTQDVEVGPWRLSRGTLVRITPYVVHRDPGNFEQPDAFVPDRFLPSAPPLPRGAWFPFGMGPRACQGQHFAMMEMTLVAALLVQRFHLAVPAGSPVPKPVLHVTLRPAVPIVLQLTRRVMPSTS